MDSPHDSSFQKVAPGLIVLVGVLVLLVAGIITQPNVDVDLSSSEARQICIDCAAPPQGCNYEGASCQSCGTLVCPDDDDDDPFICIDCAAPPQGCHYDGGSCQSCGTLVCDDDNFFAAGPILQIEQEVLNDNDQPQETHTANPGDEVTFQMTITNVGDVNARNVRINTTLPNDLLFIPGSVEYISGNAVPFGDDLVRSGAALNIGNIARDQDSKQVVFKVLVDDNASTNVITVTTDTWADNHERPRNDSAQVIIEEEVLLAGLITTNSALNLSDSNGWDTESIDAQEGNRILFGMQVHNVGDITADDVTLRYDLPPGLSYTPGTTTVNGNPQNDDGIVVGGISLGSLGVDDVAIVYFRATVDSGAAVGTTELITTAHVSSSNAGGAENNMRVVVQKEIQNAKLRCSPASQELSIPVGTTIQTALLAEGGGGIGTYEWQALTGTPQIGSGEIFKTKYTSDNIGSNTVRLTSGTQSVDCIVRVLVTDQTPTPTATPTERPFPGDYGLREGDVISSHVYDGDVDVYIVNIHGFKRLFLNEAIYGFYDHLTFGDVKPVTPNTRDLFETSGIFRNCETDDQRVYGVEVLGEDFGVLHHVQMTGAQAFAEDPEFFNKVFCINNNEFDWYPKSQVPYTSLDQIPVYSR